VSYTVQIDHINFERNEAEGTDGSVYYLILSPCPDDPCNHVCRSHPRMVHHYERQAFRRGKSGHRANASAEDIANDHANVWGWDGNQEAPTLTPSFLALDAKGDRVLRPYRMHSYLTKGRLDVLGDSTVQLHPNPVPCHDD
jgi:hypothetical protein